MCIQELVPIAGYLFGCLIDHDHAAFSIASAHLEPQLIKIVLGIRNKKEGKQNHKH